MGNNNAEFKIGVKTESDLKGFQAAEKAIEQTTAKAKEAEKATQAIAKESNRLFDAFKQGGGGVAGIKSALGEIRSIYKDAGGGITGFFGVVSGGAGLVVTALGSVASAALSARKAINEFAKGEEGVLRLQAALATAGHLSEETNAKYQQLAKTLKGATGENFVPVLRLLTQFGSTPESIERDAAAVENFAGIVGDLETAAMGVAKAMQGEFEIFGRWGIQVDQNATKAEKLNQVYTELAQRGAGQLRAAHEGLEGQAKSLDNAWHGLWKNLGGLVAETGIAQYLFTGFAGTLNFLSSIIGKTIPVQEHFRNSLVRTKDAAIDAEKYNREYAKSLETIAKNEKAAEDAARERYEKQKQVQQGLKGESDAQHDLELKQIERLEKTGGISKEDADLARAASQARADTRSHNIERQERLEQAEYLNTLFTSKKDEIDAATAKRDAAKRELDRSKADNGDRARLGMKLGKDVDFARGELQRFEFGITQGLPFSSPELGIDMGPNEDVHGHNEVREKLKHAIRIRQLRMQRQLQDFDLGHEAVVEGAQKRANDAENFLKTTKESNEPAMREYAHEFGLVMDEQSASDRTARLRARSAAIGAGTEAFSNNANANVAGVEKVVLDASGQFQGRLSQMGALVSSNLNTSAAVLARTVQELQETKRDLEILRSQVGRLRN